MTFSIITEEYPLILASASPRRKSLLTQSGLPFRSVKSHINEDDVHGDSAYLSLVLAKKKASDVKSGCQNMWILGADTIVVTNNEILGKPQDSEQATRMLNVLSGREHKVITGFCILDPSGEVSHSEAVETLVRIKTLGSREIAGYVKTGEPYGKAGSYAIQGIGSFMIEGIAGSYTNVVGLPLCALIKALVSRGAIHGFPLWP